MIIRTTTTAVYYPIVTRRTGSIRGTGRVRSSGLALGWSLWLLPVIATNSAWWSSRSRMAPGGRYIA